MSGYDPQVGSVHKGGLVGQQEGVWVFLPAAERLSSAARRGRRSGPAPTGVCGPDRVCRRAEIGFAGNGRQRTLVGGHKFNAVTNFLLQRQALEEQGVEIPNAVLVVVPVLEFRAVDDVADLFDTQRAVHEEERLLRDGGLVTF